MQARISFERVEDLYYLTISSKAFPTMRISLCSRALEKVLDAGAVVFLDVSEHKQTQIPFHACPTGTAQCDLN